MFLTPYVHIRQKEFTPGYWYWTSHGEEVPQINLDVDMHSDRQTQWLRVGSLAQSACVSPICFLT